MIKLLTFASAALVLMSGQALALDYKFNGFVSLVGAELISGQGGNPEFPDGRDCPCFVADYNSGALYEEGRLNFTNESRAGLQLNLFFTDSFSVVTQAVARTYSEEVKIEWLYASWDITSEWTLQAGRKRIPIYYYSEFQDIGIAYTWARPPQALYGWEASNYNGASLRYTGAIGDWSLRASVYGGEEEVEDAGYNTIYYNEKLDSRWENILGGDIEVSYEWFTGRLIYMVSENSTRDSAVSNDFSAPPMEQSIIGLALNADFGDWFMVSEFNVNTRDFVGDGYEVEAPAYMLGLGARFGAFTPFLSWSRYWETDNAPLDENGFCDDYCAERFVDISATLRYDLNASMAFKLQYDRLTDESKSDFVGDANLLTVTFDMVF